MKDLLSKCGGKYAVGAFSVGNMEMVMGAISAAQTLRSPLILQIAQVRLPTSPLKLIAPLMLSAARNADVPVAVHFDHGTTFECISQALELGFTSVMYDGSHLSLEQNIENTCKMRELTDKYDATLEAEIGRIGGSEDGKTSTAICSDVTETVRFYSQTKVDALAIAIGNAHGHYNGTPCLHFDVLDQIHAALPNVPLVLHGGSGISDEDFRSAIHSGICKINIATASFCALEKQVLEQYVPADKRDYFLLSRLMAEGVANCITKHMRIFMSDGVC